MMGKELLRVTADDIRACFPKLPNRVNKGDMGRVLLVCGSYEPNGSAMCGAAYFSAAAAYKSGAGIVEIFTPKENYIPIASVLPEAVFSLYGRDEDTQILALRLAESVKKADAVVVGCGLGKSDFSRALMKNVLKSAASPLIIDADGLNIMSEDESLWLLLREEQRKRTVITPHPGEMSRLCGKSVSEILDKTAELAASFAEERGVICLLKDHRTVISDGRRAYVNHTGNAGMATAGMGDLLAGMIGAIMARRGAESDFLRMVAVGAHVHGLAGDIAEKKIGAYSLTSSNLLTEIGAALGKCFE